ncbi:Arm DNA-binding domain-containing protein [Nevskia ramosa]|uniref:Arm DNA-binding domain-containing protein n=1 Tax=Nevskia ramosa TaxID=64002 RepID=UPI003D0BE0EE
MSSIRSRPESNKLYFDFHWRGVRCREYSTLESTPANRRKMEAVLKKIEGDIALNTFDYARYFPGSTMIARFAELSQQAAMGMAVRAPAFPEPPPRSNTPLFKDFVTTWKVEKEVEWRHSYKAAVESMLQTHLLPAFGDRPIGDIDRAALLAFRTKLAEKRLCQTKTSEGRPLNATTLNRIMGIARQILDEGALRHDFVNPALKIKRLKAKRIEIQPFSMDEVRLLIAAIRADYRNYLTIRFLTGMRSAEAHGLRWKHIDFERREILIRETYSNGRTEYTKTDGSQREIQMSQPVMDAFRKLKPTKENPDGYVFHTRNGLPIDNPNFNARVWCPLLRHLGLKPRRPYQMRHTCATLWLAAGENPQWIARQLGHTTTEMLFRTYSRFVPNLTRHDGSAFDRLITGAVNGGVTQAPPDAPLAKPKLSRVREVTHGR